MLRCQSKGWVNNKGSITEIHSSIDSRIQSAKCVIYPSYNSYLSSKRKVPIPQSFKMQDKTQRFVSILRMSLCSFVAWSLLKRILIIDCWSGSGHCAPICYWYSSHPICKMEETWKAIYTLFLSREMISFHLPSADYGSQVSNMDCFGQTLA